MGRESAMAHAAARVGTCFSISGLCPRATAQASAVNMKPLCIRPPHPPRSHLSNACRR